MHSMSKRARVTIALLFAAILLVIAVLVDGFSFWVGVCAVIAGVAGLGWSLARWAAGRSPRPQAINDALWSAGNLCAGLYLVGRDDWFILGFFVFVVAATVYRGRHKRATTSPDAESRGPAQ